MKRMRIMAIVLCGLAVIPLAGAGVIEDVDMEAGVEIGDFHYRESHIMREDGVQYGLYGSIAVLAAHPWDFQFYGSFVGGDVEYDGGYTGGRSLKGDTSNAIFNFRGLAGYVLLEESVRIEPYSGLGFRYLINDLSDLDVPGTYRRQQTYLYLPLGVDISLPLGYDGRWTIGLKSEFDWMFYGFHKTDKGLDKEFDGQDGWGIRFIPYVRWDFDENVAFKLEGFGEYWKINESDPDGGFIEPENASNYYGARAGICF